MFKLCVSALVSPVPWIRVSIGLVPWFEHSKLVPIHNPTYTVSKLWKISYCGGLDKEVKGPWNVKVRVSVHVHMNMSCYKGQQVKGQYIY